MGMGCNKKDPLRHTVASGKFRSTLRQSSPWFAAQFQALFLETEVEATAQAVSFRGNTNMRKILLENCGFDCLTMPFQNCDMPSPLAVNNVNGYPTKTIPENVGSLYPQ